MSDELIRRAKGNVGVPYDAKQVNITAKNFSEIQNIEHVGEFKAEVHIHNAGDMIDESSTDIDLGFCFERYNLFVIGNEEDVFRYNNFIIPLDKVLIEEFTISSLRDRYLPLTDDARDELKRYPAIIVRENSEFGENADADQDVKIAKVEEITVQNNGVRIRYTGVGIKKKAQLYQLSEELGMGKPRRIPEFKHNHWAVKEINLLDTFRDAGEKLFDIF